MRHIVIRRPGGYGQLRLEDVADPVPGPHEVLVRVRAVGVNYADCITRMGLYTSAWTYVGYPITPGFEVAGTVASTGAGVTDSAPGAEVFAVTRFNAYASHVCVPRHQVFALPKRFSFEQAAAFPAVTLTAYQALVELVNVHEGDAIRIHSAAGGVGSVAVSLAKHLGARVVAVVGRTEKVEAARALGADVVIDKQTQDLWREAERAAPNGYDVVLDANGLETLRKSYQHLRPTGKLVVYGFHTMLPKGGRSGWLKLAADAVRTPWFNPLTMVNDNKSVLAFNLSFLFGELALLSRAMGRVLSWVDEGALPPPRVKTFALDDVASAHRELESGTSIGKLVLIP